MTMKEMLYALTDFCVQQDSDETAGEGTIAVMIAELLDYCDRRMPHLDFVAERKYQYRFLNCGIDDSRILPRHIRNNDVVCENGITLCYINAKDLPIGNKAGIAGYEVMYDCDNDVIRLFYKVTFRDNEVITIYRTETDNFKNFDFFGFYAELTSQIKSSIDEIFSK